MPGVTNDELIVKCAEAEVKPLGGVKYSISVKIPKDALSKNKKAHISVHILKNGKEELIETIEYSVLMVPKPIVCFGNQAGGKISVEEAKSTDSLFIALPDFYWEGLRYQITKFKFVITPKEGLAIAINEENGNKISPVMKEALNNLKKDDKIIFYDIYAQYFDPNTKKLSENFRLPSSLVYTVE